MTLPECVHSNLCVMRWLHHRVVDLMADHGLVEWLVHDVEMRLRTLTLEVVDDYLTDLVREAKTAASDYPNCNRT